MNFEDLIAEFKKVTLKSEEEIIKFVRSQELSYTEVLIFYKRFARYPSEAESKKLHVFSKVGLFFEGLKFII